MRNLLVEFATSVFAILAPVLAALVVGLVTKWLQKVGLSVDAERQAKLEHLVAALVAQTEEWASSRIKAGITTTAADKAAYYTQAALDKIPGITGDEAHALAQTILGRLRLGTAQVIQDVRQAATTGER